MQDRYVGDVGDFGKYGLLRLLCGKDEEEKFRLGVVWYLFRDETHNDDGKHIRYLKEETKEFRDCDPELYCTLRNILIDKDGEVITENRNIAMIENSGLLACGTLFHSETLVYEKAQSRTERLSFRKAWHGRALEATVKAQLVFLDPDNGVECKSVGRARKKGPKYVYWDELESYRSQGKSLVVYHHLNQSCPHLDQVTKLKESFRDCLPQGYTVSIVVFRRGTSRAFIIAEAPQQAKTLCRRLKALQTSPWDKHFEFSRA